MKEFDFIGKRYLFGSISIIMVIISIALILTKGVNKSVDFAGGTQLSVQFSEASIDIGQVRDLVSQVDKKATVYTNAVKFGSSFTIKIKNPEVEEGKEAEASLERLQKLEKAFGSIKHDEGELIQSLSNLSVDKIAHTLTLENSLALVGTDEEIHNQYQELAQKIASAVQGVSSVDDLAQKVDPENAHAIASVIRLAFPSINRVTKDFLNANMMRFNPLQRDRGASYEDVSNQIIAFREEHHDFVSNMDDMLATIKLGEGEGLDSLTEFFKSHFTIGSYNITSNETFSPSIAAELLGKAWEAILLAMVGILIYVSMRFTTGYAVASIVALAHDVTIALGAFSLIQAELSNPVVAAFLTIVGYSLNDTIVVFDRIRENVFNTRKGDLAQIMNSSINQTLSRTLVTSLTTLFVVVVIYLGANATLRDFAFPLLIGIVVGTYSSIFVASPVLLFWSNKIRSINNE